MAEHFLLALDWAVLALAAVPLWRAWHIARATSLRHAWFWLAAAWLAWLALGLVVWLGEATAPWRHLALSLSACALTAVLGARLPGMAAWNFVVVGLLVTLLLPLAEQPWSSPAWALDEPRALFLGFVFVVGLCNYVPTRNGFSALLFGCAAAVEVRWLQASEHTASSLGLTLAAVAVTVWLPSLIGRCGEGKTPDEVFLRFRDRYGLVWSGRVIEQFNAAAANNGWPLRLAWFGLETAKGTRSQPSDAEVSELLDALLKRFTSRA